MNNPNPYKPTYNVDAYVVATHTGDVWRHYRHHTISAILGESW